MIIKLKKKMIMILKVYKYNFINLFYNDKIS